MTLKGESGSLGRKRIMNIHLARFPNSSDRMGHKTNTSTLCVLETEMQILAKFVNTKIGGIIMSIESKVYRLTNGNLMARELYDIDREIYNFLCVHTVEVSRQFFGWKRIKELQK